MEHIKPVLSGFLKTTNFWSLFFVLSLALLGIFADLGPNGRAESDLPYSSGGPDEPAGDLGFFVGRSELAVSDGIFSRSGEETPIVFDGIAVLGASHPLSNLVQTRDGLQKYRVQAGDTLSSIAAAFGVNVQTIKWANPDTRSILKVGEELVILPVSGIVYTIREGDSLESIASRYRIDPQTIRDYNPGIQKILDKVGANIILPYAKPIEGGTYKELAKNLPNLGGYFMLPARGWNWGTLHNSNAVDIADQCGKPIYASAEGLVAEESSNGFWNQGYGNYIIIEHPNGTKTRYAHNDRNLVRVGDYVSQGDPIATIGSTGNTHGPTGCHLHFEVHGARNPFAVR
ncbi:MAG TPA: M23 family metallopeptidase [Candidatus Paceibacterota bacterium]|nr:M23 family metallopeptidase [Candidatus Paceibacterota bacterium]